MTKILNSKATYIAFTSLILLGCLCSIFFFAINLSLFAPTPISIAEGAVFFLYAFLFGVPPSGNFIGFLRSTNFVMMLILFVLLMTIVLLELFNRIKKHGIVKPILSLALGVSFLIFYQISFPLTNIEIFCNILLIISLMALFFYSIYSFAIFALKTKEDSTHLDNVFKTISVYLIVIIAMTIVMCLVSVYFRYSRQTLDSLINPDEKRETYQIFYSYIFGNKPSIACLANMSLAVVWSVLLVMRLRKSKCAETSNLNN